MIVNILLLILICIQLYVIWNLNKKTETYEDMVSEYETYLDELNLGLVHLTSPKKTCPAKHFLPHNQSCVQKSDDYIVSKFLDLVSLLTHYYL